MKMGESDERTMSSAVEKPIGVNSLLIECTKKEENMAYEIENDENDDQIHDKEERTTGATLSMDNRLKLSIEKPLDLELKTLPQYLEYVFLEEELKLHVIIEANLTDDQKMKLLGVLQKHTIVIAWKISDIKVISLSFYTHKFSIVMKLLDVGIIYRILTSAWGEPSASGIE